MAMTFNLALIGYCMLFVIKSLIKKRRFSRRLVRVFFLPISGDPKSLTVCGHWHNLKDSFNVG